MKKYLIYGILAVFALTMVGCEKEESVTTKTTTTTTTTKAQSTTLQIVNASTYSALIYFDTDYVSWSDPRSNETYKLESEHIGIPMYIEVQYINDDYKEVGKVYWQSITFKNGHKYKMTLTGSYKTDKLSEIQ